VPGRLVGDLSSTQKGARLPSPHTSASPEAQAVRPDAVLVRGGKVVLFLAFAFAVMADPVSSVAYAIEAALRALNGHLELLLPTMGIVIGIIALVTLNYWQLVRAFPEGGGSPEAAGRAFGEKWSFLSTAGFALVGRAVSRPSNGPPRRTRPPPAGGSRCPAR
jgi:hypothetical protein